MPLDGKIALVTGSSSGIGLAIAQALATEGATLVLHGIEPSVQIESVLADWQDRFGKRVRYFPADLTELDALETMFGRVRNELGKIDILVNNAGMQHVSPIESFPTDRFERILALNLAAPFHATRIVIPQMKAQGWGRVINIASAHALVASPCKSAYVASKHGLLGLTKAVALEVAQQGITVNAICPGYVNTALVRDQIPDTAKARGLTEEQVVTDVLLAAQSSKRFVEVEEVAALAAFLCRDEARSITGSALSVDGGWTAH
jgi:3-hydroxybutyrate dehydrogenase